MEESGAATTFLHKLNEELNKFTGSDDFDGVEKLTRIRQKISRFLDKYSSSLIDVIQPFACCILKYVDCIDDWIKNGNKLYINKIKFLCSVISDFPNFEVSRNLYLQEICVPILKKITDSSIKDALAKELLINVNVILQNSNEELRHLIIKGNKLLLCKLMGQIRSSSNYGYQVSIMETIFNMCSPKQIEDCACLLIPESLILRNTFLNIRRTNFKSDVQIFLEDINTCASQVQLHPYSKTPRYSVGSTDTGATSRNQTEIGVNNNSISTTTRNQIKISFCDLNCSTNTTNSDVDVLVLSNLSKTKNQQSKQKVSFGIAELTDDEDESDKSIDCIDLTSDEESDQNNLKGCNFMDTIETINNNISKLHDCGSKENEDAYLQINRNKEAITVNSDIFSSEYFSAHETVNNESHTETPQFESLISENSPLPNLSKTNNQQSKQKEPFGIAELTDDEGESNKTKTDCIDLSSDEESDQNNLKGCNVMNTSETINNTINNNKEGITVNSDIFSSEYFSAQEIMNNNLHKETPQFESLISENSPLPTSAEKINGDLLEVLDSSTSTTCLLDLTITGYIDLTVDEEDTSQIKQHGANKSDEDTEQPTNNMDDTEKVKQKDFPSKGITCHSQEGLSDSHGKHVINECESEIAALNVTDSRKEEHINNVVTSTTKVNKNKSSKETNLHNTKKNMDKFVETFVKNKHSFIFKTSLCNNRNESVNSYKNSETAVSKIIRNKMYTIEEMDENCSEIENIESGRDFEGHQVVDLVSAENNDEDNSASTLDTSIEEELDAVNNEKKEIRRAQRNDEDNSASSSHNTKTAVSKIIRNKMYTIEEMDENCSEIENIESGRDFEGHQVVDLVSAENKDEDNSASTLDTSIEEELDAVNNGKKKIRRAQKTDEDNSASSSHNTKTVVSKVIRNKMYTIEEMDEHCSEMNTSVEEEESKTSNDIENVTVTDESIFSNKTTFLNIEEEEINKDNQLENIEAIMSREVQNSGSSSNINFSHFQHFQPVYTENTALEKLSKILESDETYLQNFPPPVVQLSDSSFEKSVAPVMSENSSKFIPSNLKKLFVILERLNLESLTNREKEPTPKKFKECFVMLERLNLESLIDEKKEPKQTEQPNVEIEAHPCTRDENINQNASQSPDSNKRILHNITNKTTEIKIRKLPCMDTTDQNIQKWCIDKAKTRKNLKEHKTGVVLKRVKDKENKNAAKFEQVAETENSKKLKLNKPELETMKGFESLQIQSHLTEENLKEPPTETNHTKRKRKLYNPCSYCETNPAISPFITKSKKPKYSPLQQTNNNMNESGLNIQKILMRNNKRKTNVKVMSSAEELNIKKKVISERNSRMQPEDKFDNISNSLYKSKNREIAAVNKTAETSTSRNQKFDTLISNLIDSLNHGTLTAPPAFTGSRLNKTRKKSNKQARKNSKLYEDVTIRRPVHDGYESLLDDEDEHHITTSKRRKGTISKLQKPVAPIISAEHPGSSSSPLSDLIVEKGKPKGLDLCLTDSDSPSLAGQLEVKKQKQILIHYDVVVKPPLINVENPPIEPITATPESNHQENDLSQIETMNMPISEDVSNKLATIQELLSPLQSDISNVIAAASQDIRNKDSSVTNEETPRPEFKLNHLNNLQIMSWIATGLPQDTSAVFKNILETNLRSYSEVVKIQLEAFQGTVHPSLKNLYESLVKIDNVISNYFKKL